MAGNLEISDIASAWLNVFALSTELSLSYKDDVSK